MTLRALEEDRWNCSRDGAVFSKQSAGTREVPAADLAFFDASNPKLCRRKPALRKNQRSPTLCLLRTASNLVFDRLNMDIGMPDNGTNEQMLFQGALPPGPSQRSLTTELTVWDDFSEQLDVRAETPPSNCGNHEDCGSFLFENDEHGYTVECEDDLLLDSATKAHTGQCRATRDALGNELDTLHSRERTTQQDDSELIQLPWPGPKPRSTSHRLSVMVRVEAIFERITDSLTCGEPISISLRTRKPTQQLNPQYNEGTGPFSHNWQTVRFPGRTPGEAWRFSKASLSQNGQV